jgi:universal stress protein E
MRSIRRILVAVKDPHAKSLPAVVKATQLARALGADLELFHGIDNSIYLDTLDTGQQSPKQIEDEERKQVLQQLERIAGRVRRHGVNVTTAAEWDYPVYESIVRRSARIGADLIVAERHGGRHILQSLLRLTDWELLRLSPVPVLLVKRPQPYHRPTVLAAVDPTHAFAKPAKLDQEILAASSVVTNALRGRLHAVHAYSPMQPGMGAGTPEAAKRIQKANATLAKASFDRVLRSVDIPAARRHLMACHPIDAVQTVARESHSNIVVMGAISRSGLKRIFIGNTAEQLLDRLPCDLLIVKPAEFASHVPSARRGARVVAIQPVP